MGVLAKIAEIVKAAHIHLLELLHKALDTDVRYILTGFLLEHVKYLGFSLKDVDVAIFHASELGISGVIALPTVIYRFDTLYLRERNEIIVIVCYYIRNRSESITFKINTTTE